MRAPPRRRRAEPAIALINVVFLLLIFFLIAGTVAAPQDPDMRLAAGDALEAAAPPDALVLRADGTLWHRGAPTDPAAFLAGRAADAARIAPDRDVPAARLLAVADALRAAGAPRVVAVAERGAP